MKKLIPFMLLTILLSGCLKRFDSSLWEDGGEWSKLTNNHMHWEEAARYCKSIGGRLPTISELRTLVKNCPAVEPGGECKVEKDCLSALECRNSACDGCKPTDDGRYSVFGDRGFFWSSSIVQDEGGMAWMIMSDGGEISPSGKSYGYYDVRCVK